VCGQNFRNMESIIKMLAATKARMGQRKAIILGLLCACFAQGARAGDAVQILGRISDGYYPEAPLVVGKDGSLYGTASDGGQYGVGTVFRVTPQGVFTTIASFNGTNGAAPCSAFILAADGNFYGMAHDGGTNRNGGTNGGTIFKVTPVGALSAVFHFNGTNGCQPYGGFLQGPGGIFYGATKFGGSNGGGGTIFKFTTNGLTTLHSFAGTDGDQPTSLVMGSDGVLYGTTLGGGAYYDGSAGTEAGTVFKITTGGVFTLLHSFWDSHDGGLNPIGGLCEISPGVFYGTTAKGGTNYRGSIFRITSEGLFSSLFSFSLTNGDGPAATLFPAGNGDYYGSTSGGGAFSYGTVFRFTTNGNLTVLHSFYEPTDGWAPGGLVRGRDGNVYGLPWEESRLFRIVPAPSLTVNGRIGSTLELNWNSFSNGVYRLEYESAADGTNWTALGPDITATDKISSFTNTLTASRRFYRIVLLP
jgi:uncharacterized repeat protein (TIGR03803 family)